MDVLIIDNNDVQIPSKSVADQHYAGKSHMWRARSAEVGFTGVKISLALQYEPPASTLKLFKVPVTITLCQLMWYLMQLSWSLALNYSQYLVCQKLRVNTKLVYGLP